MPSGNSSFQKSSLVERTLDVLLCFSHARREWGISELAGKLDMTKSRVFRIMKTLEVKGFAIQNPANRKYRLGLRFFELGAVTAQDLSLPAYMRSLLEGLATELGASISVRLRDGAENVLIQYIECPGPVRVVLPLGSRYPIYFGGGGMAVSAALPEEELLRLLPEDLKTPTPHSFKTKGEFLEALEEVRRNGYSVNTERVRLGVRSVGVAIKNSSGAVLGAVVAGFAKSNLLDWEIPRVAEEIKIVAARISAAFENLAMYGIRADRIFAQHGHVVESTNVPS